METSLAKVPEDPWVLNQEVFLARFQINWCPLPCSLSLPLVSVTRTQLTTLILLILIMANFWFSFQNFYYLSSWETKAYFCLCSVTLRKHSLGWEDPPRVSVAVRHCWWLFLYSSHLKICSELQEEPLLLKFPMDMSSIKCPKCISSFPWD